MMPCGDSNLWGVRGKKGGYTLELISGRQIGPHWSWHEVCWHGMHIYIYKLCACVPSSLVANPTKPL